MPSQRTTLRLKPPSEPTPELLRGLIDLSAQALLDIEQRTDTLRAVFAQEYLTRRAQEPADGTPHVLPGDDQLRRQYRNAGFIATVAAVLLAAATWPELLSLSPLYGMIVGVILQAAVVFVCTALLNLWPLRDRLHRDGFFRYVLAFIGVTAIAPLVIPWGFASAAAGLAADALAVSAAMCWHLASDYQWSARLAREYARLVEESYSIRRLIVELRAKHDRAQHEAAADREPRTSLRTTDATLFTSEVTEGPRGEMRGTEYDPCVRELNSTIVYVRSLRSYAIALGVLFASTTAGVVALATTGAAPFLVPTCVVAALTSLFFALRAFALWRDDVTQLQALIQETNNSRGGSRPRFLTIPIAKPVGNGGSMEVRP